MSSASMLRVIALYWINGQWETYRMYYEAFTHHSLVDCRPDPVVVLAVHNDLGDLESSEVGQTELNKLASLVQLIELLQSLLERYAPVCGVEVENVDTVCAELLERLVELLFDNIRSVGARSVRVPLGRTGQTPLLPSGLASECLLLATDVDSGRVNFIVAGTLEAVEDLVVVVDVRDARAFGFIWTKSHGPENDSRLAGAGDERHVVDSG